MCAVAPKVMGPTSSSLEVAEHSLVTLTCTAVAFPPPIWKWSFNGALKQSDTTPIINTTLVITSVAATDSGVYNCTAFDNVTESAGVTSSAYLRVNSE